MKLLKNKWFISVLTFFLLLIDGQLSDLLTTLTGRYAFLRVHLLIIFMFLLLRFLDTDFFAYLLGFILGLIYDSYYLNFIGITFFMLPLLVYLIKRSKKYFVTPTRSFLAFFLLLFLFEVGCYGLAFLYHLTTYSLLSFVTYQLAETLLLNVIIFVILDKFVHRNSAK
ncbi:rod shape-determining protein [Streptococcus criceti]|uniref:Rod shape-determining protein MreD family protein n=1 Tax=Streptococcus criceti HS-6 TaxID=873449 RepID=G5JPZ2_STRCG|nr:rod shape-determining protein MreD [Streptococcus criceti]EHI73727.1 rod shape-determining protein MreD family protein [Streptococcus criceti HS-6]SUN41902.1 rod shape-determining protein [Streptococcus criceti]